VIRDQIALLPRLFRTFKPGALNIFSIGRNNFIFAKRLCTGHSEW
jgi:hypothetical protein